LRKISISHKMPAEFHKHSSLGQTIGVCVDDLIWGTAGDPSLASRVEVVVKQKNLAQGDTDWTITANAYLEEKS
jgi:hypothetical protein